MEKKNLLIMIPTLNVAGAEKFVVDLALNIDKEKFNVSVGVLYKSKKQIFIEILEQNNINIVDFSADSKMKILKNIKNYFKNNKIDILHTNLNTILYTMFYAKKYKIKKCIFTFHTIAEKNDTKFKKIFYQYAFKKINFIPVGISDYITNNIIDKYKIPSNKIECIYNGVDIDKFNVVEKNNDKITLINVGTLYHVKNHAFLIRSFKKLIDKGYDLKLNILGDGQLREELENLIKDLELEDFVELKGIVNNVSDYLQQADIYCGSSIFEGLPISILEAMACGLPVVSTNAGGVVDIVKNDVNGYVCNDLDEEKYSSLIEKIILDKNLRCEMSNNSRKIVEKLSVKNCARQYEELYTK